MLAEQQTITETADAINAIIITVTAAVIMVITAVEAVAVTTVTATIVTAVVITAIITAQAVEMSALVIQTADAAETALQDRLALTDAAVPALQVLWVPSVLLELPVLPVLPALR